jgi:hypothetical protein
MTDKDRSALLTSKTRTVLLVLSMFVIVVVAFLLVRGRDPRAIASIEPPTSMPAASHPVGTQHANTPPPRADSTGTVEICGYGQVPINKSDASAIFQHVGALTKGVGTAWLSALQNSDDLRARVAGLLLEGKVTGGDSLRPVAEQTRNEVVQLAAGTGDPAVYAMALSMCDTSAPLTQIVLADSYLYSDGHEWTPIMLCPGCCSLAKLERATTALRKRTHSAMPLQPIKSTPTATLCSLLPNQSCRRT